VHVAGHSSKTLNSLLNSWGVVDVLERYIMDEHTQEDYDTFAQMYNTTPITIQSRANQPQVDLIDGTLVGEYRDWFVGLNTELSGGSTDHAEVRVEISNPDRRLQTKQVQKIYPVKPAAKRAVVVVIHRDIATHCDDYAELQNTGATAIQFTEAWHKFKGHLRQDILDTQRDSIKKTAGGYRRRMQAFSKPQLQQLKRSRCVAKYTDNSGSSQRNGTLLNADDLTQKNQWWEKANLTGVL
jgi:hypothetical protein